MNTSDSSENERLGQHFLFSHSIYPETDSRTALTIFSIDRVGKLGRCTEPAFDSSNRPE